MTNLIGESTDGVPAVKGVNTDGGIGVHGVATTNHGVHGDSTSGRGVVGISKSFFGVFGHSDTFAGVGGESATLDRHVETLKDDMADLSDFETRARNLCDRFALCFEAAALIRAASPIAEAFCRSRLETLGAHNYGALMRVDCKAIARRAAAR